MEVVNEIILQLFLGVGQTILVTVSCFVTGFIVGISFAIICRLMPKYGTWIITVITLFFRSVPVVVLVFVVYFGLPNIGIIINPYIAMNLSLGLVVATYLASVFKGAFLSIDKTELCAAKALGMSDFEIFKHIELPQMMRFAIPGIESELTFTLKNSYFAYTIGIAEIMQRAVSLVAITNWSLQIYVFVGILYFLIYRFCLVIMRFLECKYCVGGINYSTN